MLAAGAVFLSHLAPPPTFPRRLSVFFSNGYNGVTIFFVLSGFVLTWNYGDRLGKHMSARALRSFFVARVARIYPVYLFALAWVAAPLLLAEQPTPHIWHHVFAIQAWSGDRRTVLAYLGPGWSIGVEFFLYACFPILTLGFRLISRSVRGLILAAVASVTFSTALLVWTVITQRSHLEYSVPNSAWRWLYHTPWTRLGDFALGMTAAYLFMLISHTPSRWWGRVAQYAGLGSIGVLMLSSTVYRSAASFDVAYMIPTFLLILGLALAPSTVLARALSTKTMLLLGEASFAFYLFHQPLLGLFPITLNHGAVAWSISTALNLAVILCVAVGVHVLVEVPSRKLVRRWLDPAGAGRSVAASPFGDS